MISKHPPRKRKQPTSVLVQSVCPRNVKLLHHSTGLCWCWSCCCRFLPGCCSGLHQPLQNDPYLLLYLLCVCIDVNSVMVIESYMFSFRMSGDDLNPAAVPQPVEDVQGDGRWMSQVGAICYCWREHPVSAPHEIDTGFVPHGDKQMKNYSSIDYFLFLVLSVLQIGISYLTLSVLCKHQTRYNFIHG